MDGSIGAAADTSEAGDLQQTTPVPATAQTSTHTAAHLTMPLILEDEVNTHLEKDGISFIFESRSVSSVVRFVYTPIDGTFSDLELEINNMDPVLPADGGGITIDMAGRTWPADSEDVERHFVSCEQVGDCVEARWQWKYGDEHADFLYRLRMIGKSLVVEIEGGGGKATGVDVGRITGTSHARLIEIPYFTCGTGAPRVLCTNGVFVSSLIDWQVTQASALSAPSAAEAAEQSFRLNGGCSYSCRTDGLRHSLHERWLITASRHLDEVLPAWPVAVRPVPDELRSRLWYSIPTIADSEEGYVDCFEQLLAFRQLGMTDLLVQHPADVWEDADGSTILPLQGAVRKGGDDALEEYLDALQDMGFLYSLPVSYATMGASSPGWDPKMAAQLPDGSPAPAGPGQYRLPLSKALELGAEHTRALAEKYHAPVLFLAGHTQGPPWEFMNCAVDAEGSCSLTHSVQAQRQLLSDQLAAHAGPVLGEGGVHWLYPDLLHGHSAAQGGDNPSLMPLLVDFALRHLHVGEANAGLGTPEQFFGGPLQEADRSSRSPHFDRYLATTVAYGHIGLLPDPVSWGLASTVKLYYMLHDLQACYVGVPVRSIRYHHDGNLLDLSDAAVSGAYLASQIEVVYENGLQIFVNGSRDTVWQVEHGEQQYLLPPAAFLAAMPEGPLVYSADLGSGRVDLAQGADYMYCDTRAQRCQVGAVTLEGSVVVLQHDWEIDILPVECVGEIERPPERSRHHLQGAGLL
jgi:hypothetical protein